MSRIVDGERPAPRAHLSDDALHAFLAGESESAAPEEHLEHLEHLADCASCRSRLVTLHRRASEPEEVRVEVPEHLLARARRLPSAARDQLGRRTRVRRQLALAAMAVVAAGAVVIGAAWMARDQGATDPPVTQVEPVVRSRVEGSALRLVEPADDALHADGQITFRWRPIDGALRYRLRILDAVGDVLLERSTAQTSIQLDRSELGDPAGGVVYWDVTVELVAGPPVSSELRALRASG